MSSPNPASFAARWSCLFRKLSWWYGLPVTGLAKTQSVSRGKNEAARQLNSASASLPRLGFRHVQIAI
jgi:hypothetical protein